VHYSSKEFDNLYETSTKITDNKQRRALYQKMDSLVMASGVIIPLYYDEVVRFTRKNVQGLGINPINFLSLKQVKKEKLN
jgi:peptide/nickel transport system substrate-binding protein